MYEDILSPWPSPHLSYCRLLCNTPTQVLYTVRENSNEDIFYYIFYYITLYRRRIQSDVYCRYHMNVSSLGCISVHHIAGAFSLMHYGCLLTQYFLWDTSIIRDQLVYCFRYPLLITCIMCHIACFTPWISFLCNSDQSKFSLHAISWHVFQTTQISHWV